ncbi:LacI family DNA-binding transcriptional regulator [Microbacterium sp. B2969]|uniref:LacI family DNA-binding transcriptional regulator n=1 Tax=Microbacterium alkaliflavum TaxID=3248839 RepID=A0ABW7QDL0_9MICO
MRDTRKAPVETGHAGSSTLERRPTIRDVARTAGVSYGTVSRYLNGGKNVGKASALAITDAIDRTGFRRNRHARSLATGRAMTVAFLLTEPQDRLFGDPNYPILLRALTGALAERGYALVLMTAAADDERARAVEFAAGGHVDAVILVSSHSGDPIIAELIAAGVPTISCGRPVGWESTIASVSADDRGGARAAVEHLVAQGCRAIGVITGPLDLGGAVDRLSGYRDALEAAGIAFDSTLVAEGDWTLDSGRTAAARLARGDLDGLFVSNDMMAAGAVAALRAAGRRVPQDVRVVGFDDTGLAATCDPPLSSVRQPFAAISREMARLLCDGAELRPGAVRLDTELVIRGSSA